jgi:hypothetical protein
LPCPSWSSRIDAATTWPFRARHRVGACAGAARTAFTDGCTRLPHRPFLAHSLRGRKHKAQQRAGAYGWASLPVLCRTVTTPRPPPRWMGSGGRDRPTWHHLPVVSLCCWVASAANPITQTAAAPDRNYLMSQMTSDNEVQESWASSTHRTFVAVIAATSCGRKSRSTAQWERSISVVRRPWWAADARINPCRRLLSSSARKGRDMATRARLRVSHLHGLSS